MIGGDGMRSGFLSILVLMVAFLCGAPIQSNAAGKAAPTAGNLKQGKALFSKHCAGCHGPQGKGDGYKILGADPANLTAPTTQSKSDADLLTTIHEGKPNMPSWKGLLSESELRHVLAYVRTLPQ
jgi:mono/diheme cytochrome c family protein